MNEKRKYGKQLKRMGSVSTKAAGFGGQLLWGRMLNGNSRKDRAKALASALGNLKGPLMKVAQILASIPDALPDEYAKELKMLQAEAPAMGWQFVKRRMQAELGKDWEDSFKHFATKASFAASLGQVHKAKLLDGQWVACKLQYPDMVSAVASDMRQLKWIFSLFEKFDGSIQTSAIHAEINSRLNEELDYQREAQHIAIFKEMLAAESQVVIPETIPHLSSKQLLTMQWLDGKPITSLSRRPLADRNRIAEVLFRTWYVPFYRYGIIHGDPHPGNYRIGNGSHGYELYLMDFGCVRVFPARFVIGVIELFYALDQDNVNKMKRAYELWGFKNISDELLEAMNIWARFLYGPLLSHKTSKIHASGSGRTGLEMAGKARQKIKEAGGISPPREFVIMDRAAVALGGVFLSLKAELNWRELFESLIADFQSSNLEKQQSSLLKKHKII